MPAWWNVPLPEFYDFYDGPSVEGLSRTNRWSHMSRQDMESKFPSANPYVKTARMLKRAFVYVPPAIGAVVVGRFTEHRDGPAPQRPRLEQPPIGAVRRVAATPLAEPGGPPEGGVTIVAGHSANMPRYRRGRFRRRFRRRRRPRLAPHLKEQPPHTYSYRAGTRVGYGDGNHQSLFWGGCIGDYYNNYQSAVINNSREEDFLAVNQGNINQYITFRQITSKILNNRNINMFCKPFFWKMRTDYRDDTTWTATGGNSWDSSNIFMNYLEDAMNNNMNNANFADVTRVAGSSNILFGQIQSTQGTQIVPRQTDRTFSIKGGRTYQLAPGASLQQVYKTKKVRKIYMMDYLAREDGTTTNLNRQAQFLKGITMGILWLCWGDLVGDSTTASNVATGQYECFISWDSKMTTRIGSTNVPSYAYNDLRPAIIGGNQESRVDIDEDETKVE